MIFSINAWQIKNSLQNDRGWIYSGEKISTYLPICIRIWEKQTRILRPKLRKQFLEIQNKYVESYTTSNYSSSKSNITDRES